MHGVLQAYANGNCNIFFHFLYIFGQTKEQSILRLIKYPKAHSFIYIYIYPIWRILRESQ